MFCCSNWILKSVAAVLLATKVDQQKVLLSMAFACSTVAKCLMLGFNKGVAVSAASVIVDCPASEAVHSKVC